MNMLDVRFGITKDFLHLTNDWDNSKVAKFTSEMSYYALITMAHAHDFIGNKKEAEEHYLLAEDFQPQRNEHLLYLCFFLEKENKLEEMIQVINKMLEPQRVNPFPNCSFLIEDRAYYNTSNFLVELKSRIEKKMSEFSINLDSINFDFK
jgi:hypothetical protein